MRVLFFVLASFALSGSRSLPVDYRRKIQVVSVLKNLLTLLLTMSEKHKPKSIKKMLLERFIPCYSLTARFLVVFIGFSLYCYSRCQSQPINETAERNKIFEIALIKAYYENPRIYEAHSKALEGEWKAYLERMSLGADRVSHKFWRMLPDPTHVVREKGLIDWEERKRDYDIKKRNEMSENPKRVAEVAKLIREQMYSAKPLEYVNQVYGSTKLHEGDNKLPNPVALDALKQQYPDLADNLDKIGFTDEQKNRFCSGQMTINEFKTILNLKNENEYNTFIQNNFLIFPKADQVPSLTDDGASQAIKNARLTEHSKFVTNAEAHLYAGTAVLALVDPEKAGKISQAGGAAIKIYDAVGSMMINGAIDPTSIGNIATGIGAILDLLDNTPSFNVVVVDKLNQILENQRLMLIKLEQIETKIDLLQANINYLINVTQYNHNRILTEIVDIKKRLGGLQYNLYENTEAQMLIAQEAVSGDLQRKKGALILEFYNDAGTKEWRNRINAIQNPTQRMGHDTKQYFKKINELLNELAYFATVQLEGDTYSTMTDRSNVKDFDVDKVRKKLNTNTSQLVGLVPSMGDWLNSHTKGPTPLVEYNNDYPDEKLDGTHLNIKIGNPGIFSFVLEEYVDLALYRKLTYKEDGSVLLDPNIEAFCNDFQKIKTASRQMRVHIPLAIAVFNFHLKRLRQSHESFVLSHSRMRNITKQDKDGKKVIHYPGMSVENIAVELAKLPNEEFVRLCDTLRIIKNDSVIISSVSKGIPQGLGGGVNETTITSGLTIELTKPFQDKYGVNEKHEYAKSTCVYYSYAPGQQIGKRRIKMEFLNNARSDKFNAAIAREIYDRQTKVSEEWQQELLGNERLYLGDVYKAYFVLRTLIDCGYGRSYYFMTDLKPLSEPMQQIETIFNRIESWTNARDVFDDIKTADLFSKYFATYSQFREEEKKPVVVLKSIVVPIKLPDDSENSFLSNISYFQKALKALKHASWYEDIAPNEECISLK